MTKTKSVLKNYNIEEFVCLLGGCDKALNFASKYDRNWKKAYEDAVNKAKKDYDFRDFILGAFYDYATTDAVRLFADDAFDMKPVSMWPSWKKVKPYLELIVKDKFKQNTNLVKAIRVKLKILKEAKKIASKHNVNLDVEWEDPEFEMALNVDHRGMKWRY